MWHRRSGKEKTFINYTAKKTAERVGTYFYFFPTYAQGKRAIWDGMDRDGFKFIDHFPADYVESKNEQELKLKLKSGSVFQIVGTDNFDSIMSTNPIGCVFAEYSLQNPRAWDFIRPILRENGGWAIFDYTPRGKNHGHAMFEMATRLQAEGDPDWYCEKLTVNETKVLSPADIDQERREGMDEDLIQQEYFCSFSGVQQGAIFGRQLNQVEQGGRICGVPWQPEMAVNTWWDIGTGDATSIWFTQDIGREIHVIDYYENSGVGVGVDHYAKYLQTLPYVYGTHNGPHDLDAHSFAANGKSAMEVAAALGLKFNVVPKLDRHDGINAARALMSRCWFDKDKTAAGRNALSSYHYTWDDKRKMFTTEPYHDWSSNGADAFRYLGVGHKSETLKRRATEEDRPRVMTMGGGSGAWMGA